MGPFYHLTENTDRDKCINESIRVLKKGGLLLTAYISKFFVFPYVGLNDNKYLNRELWEQLNGNGVLKHDDPNCFWTDTYYTTPDYMENLFANNGLTVVDHFAQDGISPMLREKLEGLCKEQFKLWCDYHYSVCREKSIIGASNHIMIIGKKG